MARVSTVVTSRQRRKKYLKAAKGYRGGRSRLYRTARETVQRAWAYSFRDRKARKGQFRRLWIIRINAACRAEGMSYNRFIEGLRKAEVLLDRKMLAELAVSDREAFAELVQVAHKSSNGNESQ